MKSIEEIRKKIDNLDDQILALLIKRIQMVKLIGKIKSGQSLPVLDKARFNKIIMRLTEKAEGLEISKKLIKNIWERIHTESIEVEKKL